MLDKQSAIHYPINMSTETLFCQAGKHQWERECKRGRKPPNCPEHNVQASTPSPVRAARIAVCAQGHEWEHRGRGGLPKWCPEHRPDTNAIREVEYTCAFDQHTWTAPSHKGKRPRFCPEHDPKNQEKTPRISLPKIDVDDPIAVAILDGPKTELSRKMWYIVGKYQKAKAGNARELESDWGLLGDTYKRLLAEARRTPWGTVPVENQSI